MYYDEKGRDIYADLVTETSTHYVICYYEFGVGTVYREIPKANNTHVLPHVVIPNGILVIKGREKR
jgi:hypothetical protein